MDNSIKEKVFAIPFKEANVENYKKLIDLARTNNFTTLVHQLMNLASILKFDIFGFYIAKYTLNRIRVYKKSKDSKDNDHLLNLITDSNFIALPDMVLTFHQREKYNNMITDIYNYFDMPQDNQKSFFLNTNIWIR